MKKGFYAGFRLYRTGLWALMMGFFVLGSALYSQKVDFSISSQNITTDDVLSLTVTVTGGSRMQSPAFPEIPGFRYVGSSQRQTMGGGASSSSFSANYMPTQTGSVNIPSFKAKVDNQEFTSPGWQVKVGKGTGKKTTPNQGGMMGGAPDINKMFQDLFGAPSNLEFQEVKADYFLSVDVNKTKAYPGEQLLGEVVLYINESDYLQRKLNYGLGEIQMLASRVKNKGFWQEMLPSYSVTGKRTVVNGKPYVAISLYRTFLYPLEPGTISFDNVYLDARKLMVAKGGARDLFGRPITEYEPVKVYAQKKEVVVQPLPPTQLRHAGIAGVFAMTGSLSEDSLQTGDVAELKLTLQGIGNVAMLQEPEISFPKGIEVYDPVSDYETKFSDTDVKGTKTFTWTLTPGSPGEYEIGPVKMYYFHAQKQVYDSLVVPVMHLHAEGEDLVNARLKAKSEDAFYKTAFAAADSGIRKDGGNWPKMIVWCGIVILAAAAGYRVYLGTQRRKKTKGPNFVEAETSLPDRSFWES